MKAIDEKIVDRLWAGVDPILTAPRVILFFLLMLAFSTLSTQLIELSLFQKNIVDFASSITNIFKNTNALSTICIALWVFLLCPLLTKLMVILFIRIWHLKFANPLIECLTHIKSRASVSKNFSPQEIRNYLEIHQQGLSEFTRYKVVAELLTVLAFAVPFKISMELWLLLAPAILWFFIIYKLSQRMLIVYLKKVQPFKLINIYQLTPSELR